MTAAALFAVVRNVGINSPLFPFRFLLACRPRVHSFNENYFSPPSPSARVNATRVYRLSRGTVLWTETKSGALTLSFAAAFGQRISRPRREGEAGSRR